MYNTIDALEGFRTLEANWNSYGSQVVSTTCIDRAIVLLDSHLILSVFAYPLHDGGIQLDMTTQNLDITVELNPNTINDTIFVYENNMLVYEDSFIEITKQDLASIVDVTKT